MSPDRSKYETLRQKAKENPSNMQFISPNSDAENDRVDSIVKKWESVENLPKVKGEEKVQ